MSKTGQLSYRLASSNARSRSCGRSAILTGSRLSLAAAASAAAPSHRPRRIPVTSAFEVSSKTRAGAVMSAPPAISLSITSRAEPSAPTSGATRSTTTLASTTGTPILNNEVGCGYPRLCRQRGLPLLDFFKPLAHGDIRQRSVRGNARLHLHNDLLQVHHVDPVTGPALDSREPTCPDPAPDRLLRPPRSPRRLPDCELVHRHTTILLQLLLQHNVVAARTVSALCPARSMGACSLDSRAVEKEPFGAQGPHRQPGRDRGAGRARVPRRGPGERRGLFRARPRCLARQDRRRGICARRRLSRGQLPRHRQDPQGGSGVWCRRRAPRLRLPGGKRAVRA